MASRNIELCTPYLRAKWYELERRTKDELGLIVKLSCTARMWDEQRALYAQGREKLDMVNHLRANTGLQPITEEQNKKYVTWTLDSKHIISDKRPLAEAFDVFIMFGGVSIWDIKADVNKDNESDYKQVADIARSIGLKCGWDFTTRDAPHFEV